MNVKKPTTIQEFKLMSQSNSWMRIGKLARNKKVVLNNLFQHFNVENLRQAFAAIDGSRAVGIDLMTKDQYGKDLDNNLQGLVSRLHVGTYRPQAKRGVEIPKANGKTRLIAVGSFEDKLVEWVLARILTELYEPLFIETSYGFRPKRSAFQAVKTTFGALFKKKRRYVVDIDIEKFFDTVSHRKMIKMLDRRINDRKLLSLISRMLEVGIMTDKGLTEKDEGTPQGGIASPVLANIYLHYALDDWFLDNSSRQGGVISRYADDVVFSFTDKDEANRNRHTTDKIWNYVKSVLRGHFNYFGLDCNRPKLLHFHYAVTGLLFKWLNRRSQRKSIDGAKFKRMLLRNPLPFPPDVRKLKHLIDRGIYAN